MKLFAKVLCIVILLYAVSQVACWRTVRTARSPDGRHTIRIKELRGFGPDTTIKAELSAFFLPGKSNYARRRMARLRTRYVGS